MNTQPEALRLVEVFPYLENGERSQWIMDAAAELRRLHEAHEHQYNMAGLMLREAEKAQRENKELLQALKDLFNMPDYDGTPATSKVRLRAKNKARRTIAKAEAL